nr:Mut7-C RNAse domain-containing protein [Synergistales bacterium]
MSFRVCFHGDLDLFLKTGSEIKKEFLCERFTPVKDVIESMGVPHTEIGTIMAEGKERDFGFLPEEGISVHVFPITPPLDITNPTLLRPEPFTKIHFVADVNVGKLARLLRIAGFDTAYNNSWNDSTIASLADGEKRVVLTKDRNLLKRKVISYGRLIRSI